MEYAGHAYLPETEYPENMPILRSQEKVDLFALQSCCLDHNSDTFKKLFFAINWVKLACASILVFAMCFNWILDDANFRYNSLDFWTSSLSVMFLVVHTQLRHNAIDVEHINIDKELQIVAWFFYGSMWVILASTFLLLEITYLDSMFEAIIPQNFARQLIIMMYLADFLHFMFFVFDVTLVTKFFCANTENNEDNATTMARVKISILFMSMMFLFAVMFLCDGEIQAAESACARDTLPTMHKANWGSVFMCAYAACKCVFAVLDMYESAEKFRDANDLDKDQSTIHCEFYKHICDFVSQIAVALVLLSAFLNYTIHKLDNESQCACSMRYEAKKHEMSDTSAEICCENRLQRYGFTEDCWVYWLLFIFIVFELAKTIALVAFDAFYYGNEMCKPQTKSEQVKEGEQVHQNDGFQVDEQTTNNITMNNENAQTASVTERPVILSEPTSEINIVQDKSNLLNGRPVSNS